MTWKHQDVDHLPRGALNIQRELLDPEGHKLDGQTQKATWDKGYLGDYLHGQMTEDCRDSF